MAGDTAGCRSQGSHSDGVWEPVVLGTTAAIDPFEIIRLGKDVLRAQLQPLTRAELLTLIELHHLNPARLSLARLSTSQLITFIATATEAQVTGIG